MIRDVQMSPKSVHSKGWSDVVWKQSMVRDVQMSLSVGNTVMLGTSEHPLPQTPGDI